MVTGLTGDGARHATFIRRSGAPQMVTKVANRKLGAQLGGGGGTEILLWVKIPGDSDGNCGIAPNTPAGQFGPAIAIRLIDGA